MKRLVVASLCLAVAPVLAVAQSADQKKETLAYLHGLHVKGSGFRPVQGQTRPSLGASNGVLRALKYFGGDIPERDSCARFVKSCFDPASGGFADEPGGKINVHTTAVGIMAVVELKMPREPYEAASLKYLGDNARGFEEVRIAAAAVEALGKKPPQARDWLRQLEQMRRNDGSYGKGEDAARATGGVVAAILRLGGKVDNRAGVLRVLDAGQRRDGGFGKGGEASELGSSYRITRTFHMLEAKPKGTEALRGFIARCRNKDGGYGEAPGRPSSASGTYYAAIILHWLDQ